MANLGFLFFGFDVFFILYLTFCSTVFDSLSHNKAFLMMNKVCIKIIMQPFEMQISQTQTKCQIKPKKYTTTSQTTTTTKNDATNI